LPAASVVKAFNAYQAKLWATPAPITIDGPHITPSAGDDQAAKDCVAGLVRGMASHPYDLGELRYARRPEAIASLTIKMLISGAEYMTCFQLIRPEEKPMI